MIIRFTPEADAELAEARQWYAHQRENLDIEFMERIDDITPLITLGLRKGRVKVRGAFRGLNCY